MYVSIHLIQFNSKGYKNLFMIFARVIGIYVELLESSESAKKNLIHTYVCNAIIQFRFFICLMKRGHGC